MSDKPVARNLLLSEFEESWKHIRHIEEQRWTVIKVFFALAAGLVALVSALWETGFFPPAIYPLIIGVIAIQGIVTIQIIMKLRLEFCLHMTNVNMIREFFAQHDGTDLTKKTDIFKGKKMIQVFKPTSVHMGTIIPIGITVTFVCLLIPYFILKSVFGIEMVLISWVNLFYLLYMILWCFTLFLGASYDSKYREETQELLKQPTLQPLPKVKYKLMISMMFAIGAFIINSLLFVKVGNAFMQNLAFKTPYVFDLIFPVSQNFPMDVINASMYVLNTIFSLIGNIFGIILIRRRQIMRGGVIISIASAGLSFFTGFLTGFILNLSASAMLLWTIKRDITAKREEKNKQAD